MDKILLDFSYLAALLETIITMKELFENILPESIEENVFKLIGSDWMLICAGTPDHYNMMTAAWGFAGVLWKKHVAVVFVRPQRHTLLFLEEQPSFTLNFFNDEHRDLLNLCGTKSGRDINKMAIKGLDVVETERGNLGFRQARMILECRKLYQDDINPAQFLAFEQEKIYPQKDYHRFYIGEITDVWRAKKTEAEQ